MTRSCCLNQTTENDHMMIPICSFSAHKVKTLNNTVALNVKLYSSWLAYLSMKTGIRRHDSNPVHWLKKKNLPNITFDNVKFWFQTVMHFCAGLFLWCESFSFSVVGGKLCYLMPLQLCRIVTGGHTQQDVRCDARSW